MKMALRLHAIVLWTTTALLLSYPAFGQEKPKKLTRAEKKALRQQQYTETKVENLEILGTKQWVIEAYQVFDRYNAPYNMDPSLNFVMLKDDKVSIQLDFGALAGWNGVGGITLDGRIRKYDIKDGEDNRPISLRIRAAGAALGNVDMDMTIDGESRARCTIRGSFGERITFSGTFVPLKNSRVYKGAPLN